MPADPILTVIDALHRYNVGPEWTRAEVVDLAKEIQRQGEHARRLEDALLLVWAELPTTVAIELRAALPEMMDFCAHLHHSIEHEQAMVRTNVWEATDG